MNIFLNLEAEFLIVGNVNCGRGFQICGVVCGVGLLRGELLDMWLSGHSGDLGGEGMRRVWQDGKSF